MVKIDFASDHLEHERPGELVEDGVRIVVGGRGHVAQTCFKKSLRTNCNTSLSRLFHQRDLFLTRSLAHHQLHVIF